MWTKPPSDHSENWHRQWKLQTVKLCSIAQGLIYNFISATIEGVHVGGPHPKSKSLPVLLGASLLGISCSVGSSWPRAFHFGWVLNSKILTHLNVSMETLCKPYKYEVAYELGPLCQKRKAMEAKVPMQRDEKLQFCCVRGIFWATQECALTNLVTMVSSQEFKHASSAFGTSSAAACRSASKSTNQNLERPTVEEIRPTSWYGLFPMIYKVLASQVVVGDFFHQQYLSNMMTCKGYHLPNHVNHA